ncbi:MAG: ABC transporter permease [Clostridia bacterium]|nr:ABC transporter permease [Clostridia bacterium]
MKKGFYPKLAFEGIKKNRQMYLPYILTGSCMVMMYYILVFLYTSETVDKIAGSAALKDILELGGWVIAIFAVIFLFYTNSFLMKRRKKEFGLYNILGMGKRNIAVILFWESLITAAVSFAAGIVSGIVFSKLAELILIHIQNAEADYQFSVSLPAVGMTAAVFGVIFVLILLNSIRMIRFSSAIALLRSENTGEKPPKANWLIGILGIVVLVVAYYIAVTINNPVKAMTVFFIAVVMVIAATYMIMISGSVMFCRLLQKNKRYYYQSNHFVSVSSMVYRMKRNGAGLASICVLATMVLVMISTTVSLYFGGEDSVNNLYPRQIDMTFNIQEKERLSDEYVGTVRSDLTAFLKKYDVDPSNVIDYRRACSFGTMKDGRVELQPEIVLDDLSDEYYFYFVPINDYNRMTGADEILEKDEAVIYMADHEYDRDTISFDGGKDFKVKNPENSYEMISNDDSNIIPAVMVFVNDLEDVVSDMKELSCYWEYDFNTDLDSNAQTELAAKIRSEFCAESADKNDTHCVVDSKENARVEFFSIYGGMLFIGIMLSIVFIFAAVLIIYYKQISEGYEDQARFAIMQKVGMTKREIRRSINSQLLTVFFMPLIMAGTHLVFAFPMIKKMLLVFNMNNAALFAAVTGICFLAFALLYVLVYRITSNAYYQIVSGSKADS